MDVRVGLWESWALKNDDFELWCWRRFLRVPWTARRSNQSILKEISPGCSLQGLMLKLKLQYFVHLMRSVDSLGHVNLLYIIPILVYVLHKWARVDSLEKTLMLGGIGGRRRSRWQRWDGWMALLTQWTWIWVNSRSWWWTGRPGVLQFMGSEGVGHYWATELSDWLVY